MANSLREVCKKTRVTVARPVINLRKEHLQGFLSRTRSLMRENSVLSDRTKKDLLRHLRSNDSFCKVTPSTLEHFLEAIHAILGSVDDNLLRSVATYAFENALKDVAEMVVRSESNTDLKTYAFGLFYSAKHEWTDVHEFLVWSGVDIDSKVGGQSVVLSACREGNFEMANFFINAGAKLNENNFLTVDGTFHYYFWYEILDNPFDIELDNPTQFVSKILLNEGGYGAVLICLDSPVDVEPKSSMDIVSTSSLIDVAGTIVENQWVHGCGDPNGGVSSGDIFSENVVRIVVTDLQTRHSVNIHTFNLHVCARRNWIKGMEFLLKEKFDVDFKNNCGKTALMVACERGHRTCVEILIRKCAKIDQKWLCLFSHYPAETLSLESSVSKVDDNLKTVNIHACVRKLYHISFNKAYANADIPSLRLLLDRGMSVDTLNEKKETLLFSSCSKGHVLMVEFLLSRGADLNFHPPCDDTSCGYVFLMSISQHYNKYLHPLDITTGIIQKIYNGGANLNSRKRKTIAKKVFANGQLEIASVLLETEVGETLRTYKFLIPVSIERNWFESVRCLLEKKGERIWNQMIEDCFISVAKHCDFGILKFLLEKEPTLSELIDRSALIESQLSNRRINSIEPVDWGNYLHTLRLLLEYGNEELHKFHHRGMKAFIRIIKSEQFCLAEKLLNVDYRYWKEHAKSRNCPALHPIGDSLCIASLAGDVESLKLLICNGADVNSCVSGETPLFYAFKGQLNGFIYFRKLHVIEALLKAGANPNIGYTSVEEGRLPLLEYVLDSVCNNEYGSAIILMLVQYGIALETNYSNQSLSVFYVTQQVDISALLSVAESQNNLLCYLFQAGADLNLLLYISRAMHFEYAGVRRSHCQEFTDCLDLCKALVLSGYRIRQTDLQMIEDTFDDGEDFCAWHRVQLKNPASLRNICRMNIRTHARKMWGNRSILPAIDSLPLPEKLKLYIKFKGVLSEVDIQTEA